MVAFLHSISFSDFILSENIFTSFTKYETSPNTSPFFTGAIMYGFMLTLHSTFESLFMQSFLPLTYDSIYSSSPLITGMLILSLFGFMLTASTASRPQSRRYLWSRQSSGALRVTAITNLPSRLAADTKHLPDFLVKPVFIPTTSS